MWYNITINNPQKMKFTFLNTSGKFESALAGRRFVYKAEFGGEKGPEKKAEKKAESSELADLMAKYRTQFRETRDFIDGYRKKGAQYAKAVDAAQQELDKYDPEKTRQTLGPENVRAILSRLDGIIESARKKSVEEARNEAIKILDAKKKRYTQKIREQALIDYENFKMHPETRHVSQLALSKYSSLEVALFNGKIRGVEELMQKYTFAKTSERDEAAESAISYAKLFTAGTDAGADSLDGQALQIFDDYRDTVKGHFCTELAKDPSGTARRINEMMDSIAFKIDELKKKTQDPDEIDRLDRDKQRLYKIVTAYLDSTKGLKAADSYKARAVYLAQFLDDVYVLRRRLEPENQNLEERRGFAVATQKRVETQKNYMEKGWQDAQPGQPETILVAYKPQKPVTVVQGVYLHFGPEDGAVAGLHQSLVSAGDRVNVHQGEVLKVKGVPYVKVDLLDAKGHVTRTGWITAESVNIKPAFKKARPPEGPTIV